MKLHLLGVNGPFPESNSATSGYLLEVGTNLFQLDLGSGTLALLTALTAPESLSALFISHWHYDHTADLPVLMYRLQALARALPVFGPADTSSPVFQLITASPSFPFTEVKPGDHFVIGSASIAVTDARHPVPAVGYRITHGEKSFGYTGDTNTLSSLAADFDHCRLLLADGLFTSAAWSEDKPHLSAELAAQLAAETHAEELIITHLNPFIASRTLLEEARRFFPSVRLAEKGMVIDL